MRWSQLPLLVLLSLTVAPTAQPAPEDPLPLGMTYLDGPLAESWTKRRAHVRGSRVRLNGLGVRTHANWVLFRLPFDTTQRRRLRSVTFHPSSGSRTGVGALRIGSVCIPMPPNGSVEDWTLYTVSGVGYTTQFHRHPAPPTDDPTILGINVPTRVANYVACGWDDGHLRDPEDWGLDITWEER